MNKLKYRVVHLLLNNKTIGEIVKKIKNEFKTDINSIEIMKLYKHAENFFKDNQDHLDVLCNYYCNINNLFRKKVRIHSFASSYEQNSMWAYYCKNKGICIEYDYSKLKNMSYDIKRLFLQTQKVSYSTRRKNIRIDSIVEYILSSVESKPKISSGLNYQINQQLITKDKSWKQEDEWRLFASGDYEKIPVDIVTAIIIDEEIINCTIIKKVLDMARKREWNIIVRKLNKSKSKYLYEKYLY